MCFLFGFVYYPFAPGPHQALFYSQKCIINNSTLYQLFCYPKEAFWSSGYSNITNSFFFKTHYNKFTRFEVKNIPLSVNLIDSLCESIFRANPVTQSIERLFMNPENLEDLWFTCVSMKLREYLKCQILVNKAWHGFLLVCIAGQILPFIWQWFVQGSLNPWYLASIGI